MIITLLAIAGILYLALQLEDKLKIPSPLGLIALSFLFHAFLGEEFMLTGDAKHFAVLVLFLLPVLLISDSLELSVSDLKQHGISLFALAVVAVSLSVVAALLVGNTLFSEYHLSTAAIIVLFAMVLATDPVSVVSIFSKFELPHQLKILCEGESLFNDATAVSVFVFIGLYALEGGEITTGYITEVSLLVVLGSAFLGVAFGYLALLLMKTTTNRTAEMMVLLIVGYGSFEISEHFYTLLNMIGMHSHMHLSGILTCIFATITVNHIMMQAIEVDNEHIEQVEEVLEKKPTSSNVIASAIAKIKMSVEERDRHLRTKEDVQLLALVANTMLFVAMAEVIDLSLLWHYKTEILVMFLATTVIRGVMMGLFAWVSNHTDKMTNVNFRWWGVLTFAGIKGGLSIVMLMMIPASFEHLEMFKAVVIGVILLSTFIYSIILIAMINKNQSAFSKEKEEEVHDL
ncbi:MAG: cation:proton antiporter [Mariprofundaceae bacterium]|nr:cation:proton antiporter [Mariprofundaceae bacterium]